MLETSNPSNKEKYFEWLLSKVSSSKASEYYFSYKEIEDYCLNKKIINNPLLEITDTKTVYKVKEIVEKSRIFRFFHKANKNKLVEAIGYFYRYLKEEKNSFDEVEESKVSSENFVGKDIEYIIKENLEERISEELKYYQKILTKYYPRGFRYNSPIDMRKFRAYWENMYGEELDETDDEVYNNIDEITIVYTKGKQTFALIPETLLSEEYKEELFSYIDKFISKGKQVIYYEVLYEEMTEVLCDSGINNPDMLKTYLSYMSEGQYYMQRSYLTKKRGIKVDPLIEVRNYLIKLGNPIRTEELCDELSQIPRKQIELTLRVNKEFIRNAKSEYFHPSAVEITEDELAGISDIINQEIEENFFMSENELIEAVKTKYPQVFERQTQFSKLGMRDAIGYKLIDQYSFKGKIISEKGKGLSMSDVYASFCKKKHSFKLEDLKTLKKTLNSGVIYFDVVYANALRISKNEFVSKNLADFDIKKTDEAIDRFCEGNYIPIKDIQYFGSFPDAAFSWNSYLLEHYVAEFSSKYKLIHINFNESSCVGAIVKKTADIEDYFSLVVDVIVSSKISLNSDTAIDYLYKHGFLGRRLYKDIDRVLIQAKAISGERGR